MCMFVLYIYVFLFVKIICPFKCISIDYFRICSSSIDVTKKIRIILLLNGILFIINRVSAIW